MNNYLTRIKQSVQQINQFPELHSHRLIVVVTSTDSMQALPLEKIADHLGFQYLNVNFELSRLLLEVPKQQQPIKVFKLLNDEIIRQPVQQGLVLDHLEILFDIRLRLDPMRCLLDIARRHMVIARWTGAYERGHLIYAEPGHPEYAQYQAKHEMVISVKSNP